MIPLILILVSLHAHKPASLTTANKSEARAFIRNCAGTVTIVEDDGMIEMECSDE